MKDDWRRTTYGWERKSNWNLREYSWWDRFHSLHPAIVALLQLSLSMGALAALPPNTTQLPDLAESL